VLAEASTVID
jgi:hypothetical protein